MVREESIDMVPVGLKVLVVDYNKTCLGIIERLLTECKYIVTTTTEAVLALKILKENKGNFDIVISEVHMQKMDGIDLLQHIRLELDIPVIMLSANDDPRVVMKSVKYGAVDYLLKPVRLEGVKLIWQHVVRKRLLEKKKNKKAGASESEKPIFVDETKSAISEEMESKKRNDNDKKEGGGREDKKFEGRRAQISPLKKNGSHSLIS